MTISARQWKRQPPSGVALKSGVLAAILADVRAEVVSGAAIDTSAGMVREETTIGRAYRGTSTSSTRAARVVGLTASSSFLILAAYKVGASDVGIRASNNPTSFRLLEILTTSGVLSANSRGSDSASRTITGPSVAEGQVVVAAASFEAGVGVSLSVDGIDYGTTSFSLNLSNAPTWIQDSISTASAHMLTAILSREWLPMRTELTVNPWQIFAPRRAWVPQAAAGGLPALSLATYVPGSLTATGFRPRVTAT